MTPSTSVTARPRFRPVRSPLRMRHVAHCIVNELATRMIVDEHDGRPMGRACRMNSVPSGGQTGSVALALK